MFLYSCFEYENHNYDFTLLKYLLYLYNAKKNNGIVIAQQIFENYDDVFKNKNEFNNEMCSKYQYRLLSKEERNDVEQYFIQNEVLDDLIEEKGSKLEAILYIFNYRYEPLESAYRKIFNTIINKHGSNSIEGLVYFGDLPQSVRWLCEEKAIPVFGNEVGPIRLPVYNCMTGYVCRKSFFGTEEIKERYAKFLEEISSRADFNLFDREELLAIFLAKDKVHYINQINNGSKYEMGVAGGWSLVVPYFRLSKYMDYELIQDVRKIYKYNQICFRKHPSDGYGSTYKDCLINDCSGEIEFILNCKRISAVGSNVLFEAMLWNRSACCKTSVMPVTIMCNKDYKSEKSADIEFLNFFILCYLVPYELMFDASYLRWRLECQSEIEIMKYHLHFYFNRLGLDEGMLYEFGKNRLRTILETRGAYECVFNNKSKFKIDLELPKSLLVCKKETYCTNNVVNGNRIISEFVVNKGMKQALFIPCIESEDCIKIFVDSCEIKNNKGRIKHITIDSKENLLLHGEGIEIPNIGYGRELRIVWHYKRISNLEKNRYILGRAIYARELLRSTSWKITKPIRMLKLFGIRR